MTSPRLLTVVGTRPNLVKVAPVLHSLEDYHQIPPHVVHTGQHYDPVLSDAIIEQLDFPKPDVSLGVGSGTHAQQTAGVMTAVEGLLLERRPDAVLVPGDVNSTLGAALASVKLGVPVIHLEAGLRSRDWTMPEEINRVLTDRISDLLLCPSADAVQNLVAEGIDEHRTALVGNTMIDSLVRLLPSARDMRTAERLGLEQGGFALVTLHRPALVDDPILLGQTMDALDELSADLPVVFPVHPRTRARLGDRARPTRIVEPVPYLEFLSLLDAAAFVITDSGGVQEETSVLDVPCLTLRPNTERPITIELGTNRLVVGGPQALPAALADMPRFRQTPGNRGGLARIPLWEGRAAPRAAAAITAFLAGQSSD